MVDTMSKSEVAMHQQGVRPGCFYCEHSEIQRARMIFITKLSTSTVFLNRDQTHPGRCVVALNWHVDELFELKGKELTQYTQEVADVARVLKSITGCKKINYGIYGDTVSHLHFHLVPKKPEDDDWDDAFINNPQNPITGKDDVNNRLISQIRQELEDRHETL